MLSNNLTSPAIGWVAAAAGTVGLLGLAFIILFFMVGQPFGTLNDICNGLVAVLCLTLVWTLYPRLHAQSPLLSQGGLVITVLGALLAVIGSYRVISGVNGWYLSGLYTAAGYALIGIWLLGFNHQALQYQSLPRSLVIFGLITGGILALGLVAIPGIFRGADPNTYDLTAFNTVWWISSLGYLTIFPAWCIWLGRLVLSGGAR